MALARPAWPFVLAALSRETGRALLVVAPGDDEARDLATELGAVLGRGPIALWPTRGVPAGGAVGPSPHLVGLRARALATLGPPGSVVIAGAPALAERVPAASARQEALEVSVGQALSLDDLVDRLVAMGYERVPQVEERGDLSVRGGILDVYPSTADLPARIELFGDEVESMRAFSPFTQRTIRPISRLAAWPAAEPAGRTWPTPSPTPGPAIRRWCGWRPPSTPPPCARRPSGSRTRRPPEPWSTPRGWRIPWPGPRPSTSPRRPDPREPALDAVEARFATRSATEAEGELARLGRSGLRVVVAFGRRGDMARAAARLAAAAPAGAGARGAAARRRGRA